MTALQDAYLGDFYASEHFPTSDLNPVVICHIALPNTERDEAKRLIDKAIVSFAGERHRLILGKTNYRLICSLLGSNDATWIGKTICLRKHYIHQCGGVCPENYPVVRVAVPPGTAIPINVAKYYGQSWPYGTDEPANRQVCTLPIKPPSISDDVLRNLPMPEREAYFMAWLDFCNGKQDAMAKIRAKARTILDGPTADRLCGTATQRDHAPQPTMSQRRDTLVSQLKALAADQNATTDAIKAVLESEAFKALDRMAMDVVVAEALAAETTINTRTTK